jgi:HSP20 family protein
MSDPVRPWHGRGSARRDPFAVLEAFQERLNRTFSYAFGGERAHGSSHPDVDMAEHGDRWVVEVRLPGVAPDEVAVDLTDRELRVRSVAPGKEHDVPAEPAPTTVRWRRSSGFMYRLTLPPDVDSERIDATMDHGLLRIEVPRSDQPRTRHIEIGRPGADTPADPKPPPGDTPPDPGP